MVSDAVDTSAHSLLNEDLEYPGDRDAELCHQQAGSDLLLDGLGGARGKAHDEHASVCRSATPQGDAQEQHATVVVWESVVVVGLMHVLSLFGGFLLLTSAKWATIAYTVVLHYTCILGVTAGAHRLWSHRAYKARLPLRVLLAVLQTTGFQWSVITWARDHRVHHKHADTDADPHNSNRGLFFSHIGWVLCRKHPDVTRKGAGVDISDLHDDPILAFQHKYYLAVMPVCCYVVPTLVPYYLWGESLATAFLVAAMFRHIFGVHITALVNSVAHKWGNRPYDKSRAATDSLWVSQATLGEGWHNYHHTFPWDYKVAELGDYSGNFTTAFIDLMAWIGWAYDLKTVPAATVKARVERTGDGSHAVWGWGDRDMDKRDRRGTLLSTSRRGSSSSRKTD